MDTTKRDYLSIFVNDLAPIKKIFQKYQQGDFYLMAEDAKSIIEAVNQELLGQNLEQTDEYRHSLLDLATLNNYLYNYEVSDSLFDRLEININSIQDRNHRKEWQLLIRGWRPIYNMTAVEWYKVRYFADIVNYAETLNRCTNELQYRILSTALSGICSQTALSEKIDHIYDVSNRFIKNIIFSEREILNNELLYSITLLSLNYELSSFNKLYEKISECSEIGLKTEYKSILSCILSGQGEYQLAKKLANECIEDFEKLCADAKTPIINTFYIQLISNKIILDFYNKDFSDGLTLVEAINEKFEGQEHSERAVCDMLTTILLNKWPYNNFYKPIEDKFIEYASKETSDYYKHYLDLFIAQIYAERGNLETAIETIIKGFNEIDSEKHPAQFAEYCSNIGDYYKEINRPDSAMIYIEKAFDFYSKKDPLVAIENCVNLVKTHFQNEDLSLCKSYIEQYESLCQELDYPMDSYEHYYIIQDLKLKSSTTATQSQKLNQYKNLYKMALNNFRLESAMLIASYIASILVEKPEGFNEAMNYIYEGWEIAINQYDYAKLIDYGDFYLKFLNRLGKPSEYNRVLYFIISETERRDQQQSMSYINFLNNQILFAVSEGRMIDASILYNKWYSIVSELFNQDIDERLKFKIIGVSVPIISTYFQFYQDMKKQYPEEMEKMNISTHLNIEYVEDLFNNTISIYKELWGLDEIYLNLLVSEAKIYISIENWDKFDYTFALLIKESEKANIVIDTEIEDLKIKYAIAKKDYNLLASIIEDSKFINNLLTYNGPQNIRLASNIYNLLTLVSLKNGDYKRAIEYSKSRLNTIQKFIESQYASLTESQRTAFLENGGFHAQDFYSILPIEPSHENNALGYNYALLFKNLLLQSNQLQLRAILESNNSILAEKYNQLQLLKQAQKSKAFDVDLASKIYSLEGEIASICENFDNLSLKSSIDWKKIEKKLDKTEAALEFVYYKDWTDSIPKYGVFILRKNFKAPVFIPLCLEQDLKLALSRIEKANNIETGVNRTYTNDKLYNLIWNPIEKYLDGCNTIYYSTVGELSIVSFNAIEDSLRCTLIDKFDMRAVSSTSTIVKNSSKVVDGDKSVAIFGNVNYDVTSEKESKRATWRHLDNSKAEINHVSDLCQRHNIEFVIHELDEATETQFRNMSGQSSDIVLISTHGFYCPNDKNTIDPFLINKGLMIPGQPKIVNSLNRGGLIFTHANPVWNNEEQKPDESDGVLTANEISTLDLSNTSLIVMSACETGLGDTNPLEGVNGLIQGIKQSGIKSMIVSLWPVNDLAGSLFMQIFFNKLFDGIDRHEAFRATQLELKSKYPRKPFLWAPFVIID